MGAGAERERFVTKPKVKLGKHKGKRRYKTTEGKFVPGVTTLCGYGSDQGGLIHAAWRLGMDGINYRAEWDKAAEAGTCGHFLVECHLKGNEADLSEFSPDVVDLASNVFLKFLEYWQQEKLSYVASELELVSDSMFYGGKLDVVGRDNDARLVLIDLKSSKQIFPPHLIQVAAYEELWNEKHDEKINRRAIFRNGKKEKGDTELRWLPPLPNHFDAFKLQLALYHALRKI